MARRRRNNLQSGCGYARVLANHQNLDRQLATLKAAGCKRIFKEKVSGREGVKRPQLEKAIDTLGPGDVLVLAEWDRPRDQCSTAFVSLTGSQRAEPR
jgi:DNA invertase Pin-like site-specific DNA recombinase